MIKIQNKGIILEKTGNEFENQAVLNPGLIKLGDTVHMLYRAVREGNFSTIGYCKIKDFKVIERLSRPVLFPEKENEYEKHGLEDPEITEIDGKFYILYTVYSGEDALQAYATTEDFVNYEKHGIISADINYETALKIFKSLDLPPKYNWYGEHYREAIKPDVKLWQKDMSLFPKKINGKFVIINRILPGMQIVCFDDFSELNNKFWLKYLTELPKYKLLDPKYWYESRKIGGGCPPLETRDGWLVIYHGVEDSVDGNVYRASAALLDKDNPQKVIGRLPEPLFSPDEEWEKEGDARNVVFPTGAYIEGNELVIFYGAADKRIAAKTIDLESLLVELKNNPQ
jgi:beta-1,2-mannobiose phosphorylase / 1,2-beta-oligomannan phosphorylase